MDWFSTFIIGKTETLAIRQGKQATIQSNNDTIIKCMIANGENERKFRQMAILREDVLSYKSDSTSDPELSVAVFGLIARFTLTGERDMNNVLSAIMFFGKASILSLFLEHFCAKHIHSN